MSKPKLPKVWVEFAQSGYPRSVYPGPVKKANAWMHQYVPVQKPKPCPHCGGKPRG